MLTNKEALIILLLTILATVITRFAPFLIFGKSSSDNQYINYLGKVLPPAAISLIVVHCLRNIDFAPPYYNIPELISVAVVVAFTLIKKNTLLSIAVGTLSYMILLQFVF